MKPRILVTSTAEHSGVASADYPGSLFVSKKI